MKTFICGSRSMHTLSKEAQSEVEGLVSRGDEILVGDCSGTSHEVQKLLAASSYDKVTVYVSGSKTSRNEGAWPVRICNSRVSDLYSHGIHFPCNRLLAALNEAACLDADRGLIICNDRTHETFLSVVMLASLGKPVRVIGRDWIKDVMSIDAVHDILPERNPLHCSSDDEFPKEEKAKLLEEFVPSRDMVDFLKDDLLSKKDLVDIVLGSPSPLIEKRDACERCLRFDDVMHEVVDDVARPAKTGMTDEEPARRLAYVRFCWWHVVLGSFTTHFEAFGRALWALHPTPNKFFYRKSIWDERPERFETQEAGIAPFDTIDAVLEDVRHEMRYEEWDDDSPCWSKVEEWGHDEIRGWHNDYTYYLIRDQVVFFDRNYYDGRNRCWKPSRLFFPKEARYCGDDVGLLVLPTPFETGDIVTLDCRPFAPLCHGLVLTSGFDENGLPRPQPVLVRQQGPSRQSGDGNWNSWLLDSCSALHVCAPGYSPLYHMEAYEGPLAVGEEILASVRRWLDGDLSKAKRLDEALLDTGHGMSDEELRLYMEEVG